MNRNTSPISPFSEEDYQQAYRITAENQYPHVEIQRFKENYCRLNPAFAPDTIELANGADEWIQKLMITFGQASVLLLRPDFVMYQTYAAQLNCPVTFVPASSDFSFDLSAILAAIASAKPKLFILSNPHNPTGVQFLETELQAMAAAMAAVKGYLAIDEAYIEFGKDYTPPEGDHVIILRTMSKIYGMAGLRIGLMSANGETFSQLTRINHPYPVNSLSLNLANTFLENEAKVQDFIAYQRSSKHALDQAFRIVADKVKVYPSAANFLLTTGELALPLGEYLKSRGYLGRFYEVDGLEEAVRYSIIELDKYPVFERTLQDWRNSLD